jgi:uncharacterized membrane protein YgcG
MNLKFDFWEPDVKIFSKRLVAMILLVFFIATVCIQGVASAAPRADGDGKAERRVASGGAAAVALPERRGTPSSGDGGRDTSSGSSSRGDNSRGAGGKDAGQRERNQASGHKGHGGPQDL